MFYMNYDDFTKGLKEAEEKVRKIGAYFASGTHHSIHPLFMDIKAENESSVFIPEYLEDYW